MKMPKEKKFPTDKLELELKNQGYKYIVGVDEAGRGPLAGPVVAAAVHIPDGFDPLGINDSKKLSEKKREELYDRITNECDYSIYKVSHELIDEINIREATKMAMKFAVAELPRTDYILVDGNFLPETTILGQCVIGGDTKSVSIAAASILAKVTRDRMMYEYHKKWPAYGFDHNKGYGTKHHREILKMIGPCKIHRRSFGGVV